MEKQIDIDEILGSITDDPFETNESNNEDEEDLTKSKLVHVDQMAISGTDWTTETIVNQIEKGNIQLDPDFQRRDAWTDTKKSRFIESLMLGLPIPQIILFLSGEASPVGLYNDETYEKVAAYTLLIHAEIEHYFEEVALSIAQTAFKKWDANKTASRTLVALTAYDEKQFKSIPESTNDKNNILEDLEFRIKHSFHAYVAYVRAKNHGIKERNILALFLPIGLMIDDFDNNLLIALDNFGTSRGSIAHSTKAKQQITPPDAEATVQLIQNYMAAFDNMLYNEYDVR